MSDVLREEESVIIGIDHGFSFPQTYFRRYQLSHWDGFLDDFVRHWPTLEHKVDDVRDGNARTGTIDEFRLAEQRTGSAQSVFKLDGAGTDGKSTHTGIPLLRNIRREFGESVHFWPFDGWSIPSGQSAIVEVYPRLFLDSYPTATWGANKDERDARVVAEFLRDADRSGQLEPLLRPQLNSIEKATAELEGWILGVT